MMSGSDGGETLTSYNCEYTSERIDSFGEMIENAFCDYPHP